MNPFFGNIQAPADGNFDMSVEVIPAKTVLKAVIEESKWDTYTPEPTNTDPHPATQTFIKNTWSIIEGDYQNRKVFQKLHVRDENTGKAQRALQMLAAIDANAGGKIMAAGTMPDDMMLSMSLSNVPMNITVDVWEIGGNSGNYIIAVSRAQQPVQTVSQNQSIHQAAQNVQQQPVQQVQYAQPQQPTAQQLEAADIDF
jgi:hypothetical protein